MIIAKGDVDDLLRYDCLTGKLYWKKTRTFTALKGSEAGCPTSAGYIRIRVLGKEYLAHRLAWLLYYGEWPEKEIDHINRKRSDNRISNLRNADARQQRANAKLNRDSTSGYRGVYFNKNRGKWRAHIQGEHLGYFLSIAAAAAAYEAEFNKRFGVEFQGEISNAG